MEQIIRIGVDTSKHIFQLHGVDAAERVVLRKKLSRKQMLEFFAKLPATVIGMETAGKVADALATHPKVSRLVYPGRADHPQAALVKKQMRAGSTLVGFEVKGGKAAAFRCLNALKLARISNNLGDAKSLVTHPATTTHQRLTPEARAELGISDGFIRFSTGLEHADDLIEDLAQALEKV